VTSLRDLRPTTMWPSLLAALTTWVTLFAWMPFAEYPVGFMSPLLFAVLLVAISGMLLRAVRVSAPLVALAQIALLAVWLHHRLAGPEALGGFLPTPHSLSAAADAIHRSYIAAQTFSAPVPASVPEFYPLMILMGAATAVMVDFLAIGLRRAPLAGLPLLAVYTAPVSILAHGVEWPKFAAAALCFLFLVTAEEDLRLSRWGQRLTPRAGLFDNERVVVGGPAVWAAARRIGLVTTGVAVVAPFLIPTVTASWFDGGNGPGNGTGTGVDVTNPIVDLKRDLVRGADVNLLTIKTTDPDPSYLRVSVLNSFDGETWRPSGREIPIKQRADGRVAPPPGLDQQVPRKEDEATIDVNNAFGSRWLPTPYPVVSVDAPGDWRYDRDTMDFISAADNQTTAGLSYRLRSLRLSPTARELANAVPAPLSISQANTILPRNFPAYVRRLAENVTRGRSTHFEEAVALQQWFRVDGGFRYSLRRASGNSANELVRFLSTGRNGRVGYCEQFAAAMALMGRSLGIPSRVAVGFLRPEETAKDTWVYSSHDLHAWPEMYFGGVGWVRFEPTPSSRTGDVPSYTQRLLPQTSSATDSDSPSAAPSNNRLDKTQDGATAASNNSSGSSGGGASAVGWVLLSFILLAVVLVAPRTARTVVRRRRWAGARDARGAVEAGWRELRDSAIDLGIAWNHRVTLRNAEAALIASFACPPDREDPAVRLPRRGAGAVPEAEQALHRLVALLERGRYSRGLPEDATTAQQVAVDVDTCVAALRAGVDRRHLVLAHWLPASLLYTLRTRPRDRTIRGRLMTEPGVDRAV
jgi:transglutaminase-like putative cysteine protease